MNVQTTITDRPAGADGGERLPVVFIRDGEARTNSRDVAGYFEKRHTEVLRAIDNLECSGDFYRRNFASVTYEYVNGRGGRQEGRSVDMTKDGFTFLVMGFTGKKAARFKEAYIQRFNEMERLLRAGEDLDADFDMPSLRDRIVWGVHIAKLNAAARVASLVNRIYGPEAARALWESDKDLPDVRLKAVGSLAGTAHDDPVGCFRHLMRSSAGNGKSIGQILSLAMHDKAAAKALREYGLVLGPQEDADALAIANRHRFLASVFADTQWCEDWRLALAQLPGARPSRGGIGFGGGNARAVLIPKGRVLDLLNPAGPAQ